MTGQGPRVEDRVGPHRVAAVVLRLVCAVRVHVEQQPGEIVRRIGILPSGVEHAAVVEHGRAPVVVLVEAELTNSRAVGVHAAEIGDRVPSTHAGHAVKAPRRAEHDASIGQVTGIVVVDVRFVAGRHLAQPVTVGSQSRRSASGRACRSRKRACEWHPHADRRRPRKRRRPACSSVVRCVRSPRREHCDFIVIAALEAAHNCPASSAASPADSRCGARRAGGQNRDTDWTGALRAVRRGTVRPQLVAAFHVGVAAGDGLVHTLASASQRSSISSQRWACGRIRVRSPPRRRSPAQGDGISGTPRWAACAATPVISPPCRVGDRNRGHHPGCRSSSPAGPPARRVHCSNSDATKNVDRDQRESLIQSVPYSLWGASAVSRLPGPLPRVAGIVWQRPVWWAFV